MRFVVTGEWTRNRLLKVIVWCFLAYTLLLWATNAGMYFARMSLRPASVVTYYNGSEEEFRSPRSTESMLETTHMHLPMMAMVLLLLTHLTIFAPLPRRAKTPLIVGTFACALLQEGAGWLVRYASPAFAPLKVVGFVGLQAGILVLLAALAAFLVKAARAQRASESP